MVVVRHVEHFDRSALEPEAGIRALWLLYKRGQWSDLRDFGIERSEVEPIFDAFAAEQAITARLTKAQCRRIVELIPALSDAAVELQLSYALKFVELGRAVMMHSYYTPGTYEEVVRLAGLYADSINRVGGDVGVVREAEDDALLLVDLPEGVDITVLIPGAEFTKSTSVLVPVDEGDVGDGDNEDALQP